jgi:hypothetical protein
MTGIARDATIKSSKRRDTLSDGRGLDACAKSAQVVDENSQSFRHGQGS